MRKVILHIGANKAGSTAIQEFLRLNSAVLPAHGYTVPSTDLSPHGVVTGQQVWFFENLRSDPESGSLTIASRIDNLAQDLPEDTGLIMSAENLASGCRAYKMFEVVARRYDVRVLLYIRRQDELLLTSWQQWESKVSNDFWAWVLRVAGRWGDWRDVLRNWETILPKEKITVRLYDRKRMPNGDVIADFTGVLGLSDYRSRLQLPAVAVNPSYSNELVKMVQGSSAVFKGRHDNDFYNTVEQLTGTTYHRHPNESLVTYKQRIAILERYHESNEWVRHNYFSEMQGSLFSPPHSSECSVIGMDAADEQKWRILTGLLYGLARHVV